MDGTIPFIYKGEVGKWIAKKVTYDSAPFITGVPIGASSFVIQTVKKSSNQIILAKESTLAPHLHMAPTLLEKQVDGKFCIDGMLHFSKDLGQIIYVYFYRNQFIMADTNLNLIALGNTIDTISKAKISVAEVNSNNSVILSHPPLFVNRRSSINGQWLFINSNLLSDNESPGEFENSSVIDVYNLRTMQYNFSFYIPKYDGRKIREFVVTDSTSILVIYERFAVKFKFRMPFQN